MTAYFATINHGLVIHFSGMELVNDTAEALSVSPEVAALLFGVWGVSLLYCIAYSFTK